MEFPGPRTPLEQQLFRAHRSWRSRLGQLGENRKQERDSPHRHCERIGLGDLASDSCAKIGNEIVAPGTPLGVGLTKSAARDFGLLEGTPVGASLIDAHAGGVGTIGGRAAPGAPVDVCRRLAYIMGTS